MRKFFPRWIWELLKDFRRWAQDKAFEHRLFDLLQNQSIDLVYERLDYTGSVALKWCQKHRVPHVLEVHAPLSEEARFMGEGVRPLGKFFRRRVRHAILKSRGIVGVSGVIRDWAIAQGANPAGVEVVPNGVRASLFDQKKPKENDKMNLVIGFVGSNISWHGLPTLVRAFARFLLATKNESRLKIVGKASENKSLRALVEEHKIQSNVDFIPAIPYEEVSVVLNSFDIAVMASSNSYGSPIKLFEYAAIGLPTIAPRVKPVEEVFEDGIDCIMITPGDEDELCEALVRLSKDSELRKTLGSRMYTKVMERYTWEAAAKRIQKFFKTGVSSCVVD